MAASLDFYKYFGTAGTSSALFVSETAIGEQDAILAAGQMSIGVPDSGYEYSYELVVRAIVDNPPDNLVSNMRVWGDLSGIATGVVLFVGSASSYSQPVKTVSSIAIYDIADYTGISDAITIGGRASLTGSPLSYIYMQMRVHSSADYEQQELPVVVHYAIDQE